MLKYPSILFPTIYYSIAFGAGSVLFAVTGSAAFGSIYKFVSLPVRPIPQQSFNTNQAQDTVGVGLAIGLPTFIGTLIGELSAGPVSDRLLYNYRKKHGGEARPEARLQATWPGVFLLPIGIVIEGVCFQYKTHYMGPILGIGISAFGLQIVSTNIYAYVTDVSSLLFPSFVDENRRAFC